MQHANDHVGSVGFVLPNLEVRLVREEDGMVRVSGMRCLFS